MKFKYKLSASISADTLRRIYAALEEEEKPFTANVRNIAKGVRKGGKTRMVIIENDDRNYFAELLAKCKIQN